MRAAWLDENGTLRTGLGRLIDISEGGLALELPQAPLDNSTLRFQCDRLRLYGIGNVRYGGGRGRCVIGVQFSAGTHWKANVTPNEEVVLPPRAVYGAPIELDWEWDSGPAGDHEINPA
ncbi:MAG: PilZ domain-containing protein [Bryobacteraceae bacterium]